ncbi:MAG TPA: hypothetical protein VM513_30985 [Kofleriaceae bacterium]|jgi:hypothetical protein|nr:hypothetical protein [Kofleriaceae bacterium]
MSRALLVLAIVLAGAGVAHAYPQFQLSIDQTCTGCHISPSGGGLLNENGLYNAEAISTFGTAPEFLNGLVETPSWLTLGGHFRGSTGFISTPEKVLATFPMQGELYASAKLGAFRVNVTGGIRPTQEDNRAATTVWSREHYVMWQSKPDENEGIYVRAGRFMPVFGLRVAEHPTYVRRYGGTQLFSETYGLSAAYVSPKWEAHATAFIKDPLIDPVVHDNGGALYAEARLGERLALGVEGMVRRSDSATRYHTGVTGKYYVPAANLLLQAELQYAPQTFDVTDLNPAGGNPRGIVGALLASFMLPRGLMLDVGLGHYDRNYKAPDLDRDNVDVNLHWFATSHLELVLNTRYETLAFGSGGRSGGYALFQLHYRL